MFKYDFLAFVHNAFNLRYGQIVFFCNGFVRQPAYHLIKKYISVPFRVSAKHIAVSGSLKAIAVQLFRLFHLDILIRAGLLLSPLTIPVPPHAPHGL